MTPHDIIKHGAGRYECSVCNLRWKTRPRTVCPGVKVYPKNDHVPLMTKEQLKYMGYQTTAKSLPAPNGGYVRLYDPAQALKRKSPGNRRITSLITEIHWPQQAVLLIEDLHEFLQDRALYNRTYEDLMNEMANMTAHFAAFTSEEIEHLAGDCVHLTISPSLIRRSYPSFRANTTEQIALASRIVAAYQRYKATLC